MSWKFNPFTGKLDMTAEGTGISNVVEDTTPQLGGDLDTNSHNIDNVTPTELDYVHGVTSGIQTQLDSKVDNPMTTLGDIIYEDSTPAMARLAGNTTTTKKFLTQTGDGTVSAAPVWGTIVAGDIPSSIDAAKIADGSVSNTEFQYINSLTSNAQTQIDGKQASDAGLTSLAGLTYASVSFVKMTGADTFSLDTNTYLTTETDPVVGAISGIVKADGSGNISAAASGTDYEVPLTFSTGLTRSTDTITVNTSQNISTLSNLTTNGFVKTGSGTGALSIDTNTYLTGNQSITLSGDVTGSGATAITTTIAANAVDESMLNIYNAPTDQYYLQYDATNGMQWAAVSSGGDVNGPASSTDNDVVLFDGTNGKLIKDSGLTLSGTNTGDQDLSGLALKTTTISTTAPLSGGGDLSANRTFTISQATTSADGYLSSTDWNTFNNKQDALPVVDTTSIIKGSADATKLIRFEVDGLTTATTRVLTVPDKDFTIAGVDDLHDAVTIGTANGLSLSTQILSLAAASSTVTGALTSTDWVTFNNKAASGANSDITSLTGLTTALGADYGGTGVANDAASTITITGAYSLGLTLGANTSVTLPVSGTLMANLAEDTTPQLGGELDAQAHSIGFTLQTYTGAAGTTTVNWTSGNKVKFTFGAGNETLAFTAPSKPCNLVLMVIQDSTGGRTITWPSTVKWPAGTAPTLSTAANAVDIVSFLYDGANYYGQASLNFS